jgi:Protein of unknown function (DUF1674)
MKSPGHSGTLFPMSSRIPQGPHEPARIQPGELHGQHGGQQPDNGLVAGREPRLPPREIGGPEGPEPTRYGDWEKRGRCIDF